MSDPIPGKIDHLIQTTPELCEESRVLLEMAKQAQETGELPSIPRLFPTMDEIIEELQPSEAVMRRYLAEHGVFVSEEPGCARHALKMFPQGFTYDSKAQIQKLIEEENAQQAQSKRPLPLP